MHKIPILRFNKLKIDIENKAITDRSGLTIEYIGELNDKFGMAKKKILDVDLVNLRYKNNLFHNPKLNLIHKFTFPKQNFQEFRVKKKEEDNHKIIKIIEKNIVSKMEKYFQKRIQNKSKSNLQVNYFRNITSNNYKHSHILSEGNNINNNIKNKSTKFQLNNINNKYQIHQTSVSHDIPEKIFFKSKFRIKEEKQENENNKLKLYCDAGTNTEESNPYNTIQTENFSSKKVYTLPKIQYITYLKTPRNKLKLSFEKKRIKNIERFYKYKD